MALFQMTRPLGGLRAIVTAGFAAVALCAFADPAAAQQKPDKYGHYNQNATEFTGVCGDNACGPIALLNSLVFLQNTYASLDGKLVGKDPVETAKTLAKLMKCDTKCGTNTFNFFKGKKQYLKDLVGNAIDSVMYNGPTFDNLSKELTDGEDVEMFITFDKADGKPDGGHYVTLYDITKDTLSFVDPGGLSGKDGGKIDGAVEEKVKYTFDEKTKRIVLTDYEGTPTGDVAKASFAFAESPHKSVPEPQAWALMIVGFGALGAAARQRRALAA